MSSEKVRIVIVGAGGHGREIYNWLLDPPFHPDFPIPEYESIAFLTNRPGDLDDFPDISCPIIGDPSTYQPQPNDRFLCGLGDPIPKLPLCRGLKSRGAQFLSFVHLSAIIGRDVKIGEGFVMLPGAVVTTHVRIGKFVSLNNHASVSHDCVIGDGCSLSPHTSMTGFCSLEEGAYLGVQAALKPHMKVGAYAFIGAGAIVVSSIPAHTMVVGVPAKPLVKTGEDFGETSP